MEQPYLIRTGSGILCSPPAWTHMPENWPLRSDFEFQYDIIDAPEGAPAGGVRAVELSGGRGYQTQYAARY